MSNNQGNPKQLLKDLKYRHVDLALKDITAALSGFKNLASAKEHTALPNFATREYLVLRGTIPIDFKNRVYHIPVCLYLLDTHPYNPPVIYVRPTPDMVVNEGRHVDRLGRVYLPYLAEWKYPASDLTSVLQVMTIVFSEVIPVYTRPGSAAQQQPNVAAPPPMPASAYPGTAYPPVYPPAGQQPPGFPQPYAASQPIYPQAGSQPIYPPSQPVYPNAGVPPGMPSWQQPPRQSPVPTPAVKYPAPEESSLSNEQIRASVASAVEDSLRRRFREMAAQYGVELATLRQTHQDLIAGRMRIAQVLSGLDSEKRDIETRTSVLEDRRREVETILSRLAANSAAKSSTSVDELVAAPFPLYRQLMECHAEEMAIDDAIYFLGKSFGDSRITLDIYLRQVRVLSARQFMCRALVDKCRTIAGLAPLTARSNGIR